MMTAANASRVLFLAVMLAAVRAEAGDLRGEFAQPPLAWKSRPLWFWNGPLSRERTEEMMEKSVASGYAGFGILPAQKMTPAFMTAEFLDRYNEAVEKAAALGLKLCLYDEYWFPSGSAGEQLAKVYPEALAKRLDMDAVEVTGPQSVRRPVPAGRFMGAVAMNTASLERVDLTNSVKDGQMAWEAPEGNWRVMLFTCVTDGARGLVDYLEEEAVTKFASMTYDKYYARFPKHFGTTIDSAFFDEPTMSWVQGGRAWTGEFNRKFEARYGYSPVPLYPALWFDIGPETAAARNALLGFRTELYSDGFTGTLARWCREHRIALTGHHDQEEVVNPVSLCGDMMRCFRDQDIPGIDQIFQYGRGSRAYKVVSSAANNYDRPLVMVECYGAIEKMPVASLYKEAMDLFAKGINLMVPHAVWYDSAAIVFEPELSYLHPVYGPALPAYNDYIGRLQRMLQTGRHVADVGVLYPIATLQAAYRFGVGDPREGGVTPAEADYMAVGEMLSLEVRRDYTFIHPDILDERCRVAQGALRLENKLNPEAYRVFLIPGSKVIRWSNLEKIRRFWEAGGQVIATTALPEQSAEFGKDGEVRAAVKAMFGDRAGGDSPVRGPASAGGGRAVFIPKPSSAALQTALAEAVAVGDVEFEEGVKVAGGNLSYIHKVVEGREVFFFGNSSDTAVDVGVRLRGRHVLEEWDPHTGEARPAEARHETKDGQELTRMRLKLPPVRSVFWVTARP